MKDSGVDSGSPVEMETLGKGAGEEEGARVGDEAEIDVLGASPGAGIRRGRGEEDGGGEPSESSSAEGV
jgi:hypothetical protein